MMEAVRSVRELARRLGLSPATVSLALNGNVSVAAATRSRVLAGAKLHGYRANPVMAQAMAREKGRVKSVRRSMSIAYVRSTFDDPLSKDPHWRLPYKGLLTAGDARGFTVEDFNLRHYRDPKELIRILYHRGFHAVVLGIFIEPRILELDDRSPFALLTVGRCDVLPRVNCIRRDEASGIRLVWERIRERGYHRPGFCLMRHDPLIDDDRDRLGAWWIEAQTESEENRIPPYRGTLPNAGEGLLDWYQTYKPDVVVGFNGTTRWTLKKGGIRIPQDCAYMQLHISPSEKGVSGLSQDLVSYGERCVSALEHMLNTGTLGVPKVVEDIVLQPEWVDL